MTFVNRVAWTALSGSLLAFSPSASAVLIGLGDGTGNTTQPQGLAGWSNVGRVGSASGVYLGNGWVLTAHHVGLSAASTITFYPSDQFPTGGVTYALDFSTRVQLRDPNNSNLSADLDLVRTVTDPGLSPLKISTASPTSAAITMVGFGVNRGAAVQYNATWQQVDSGGAYAGYLINPNGTGDVNGFAKRWGTSTTTPFPGGETVGAAFVNDTATNVFTAAFTPSTSIGVSGDSGGAVFSSAAPNTLLGIILYEDYLSVPAGQPNGNTSSAVIFGNGMDAADLSQYNAQIQAVIPEPANALLIAGLFGFFCLRHRRPLIA